MKSKEEILREFGCPEIPFNENVTMYYPAILSAMDEYASQQAPASTPPVSAREDVFNEIKQERIKQDAKWGEQNHAPADWLMILGEEVGEVNKAALEAKFGGKTLTEYREELVQVAAVTVAMIECFDRNHLPPPPSK